jgi:hypothetical protein
VAFDFSKRGGVRAAAEWIRDGCGAAAVIVVLRDPEAESAGEMEERPLFRLVGAMDAGAAPGDIAEVVSALLPGLAEQIHRERREKRARRAVDAYGAQ